MGNTVKSQIEELKEMLNEQKKARINLSRIEGDVKRLTEETILAESRVLFKQLDDFSKLFLPGGIVRESFASIVDKIRELESYDPQYRKLLDKSQPTDDLGKSRFYLTNLLGGPLRSSADLWQVLSRICETRNDKHNPFITHKF